MAVSQRAVLTCDYCLLLFLHYYYTVTLSNSNAVLQTLLVLLKKDPPTNGHRLLVLATTSVPNLLEDLGGLIQAFNVSLHVPQVSDAF
jgi:hypothetical protein